MENRMKDVAELLGVELGEEFEVEGRDDTFWIAEKGGLMIAGEFEPSVALEVRNHLDYIFVRLLSGEEKIIRKPFAPKMGEFYYAFIGSVRFDTDIRVQRYVFDGCLADYECISMGNCFKSEKDALKHKDEVAAFYKSIAENLKTGDD